MARAVRGFPKERLTLDYREKTSLLCETRCFERRAP
jgi:hypothetical protein